MKSLLHYDKIMTAKSIIRLFSIHIKVLNGSEKTNITVRNCKQKCIYAEIANKTKEFLHI